MKKILFFSPYYFPYISGLTTYPFKILSYLSKRNTVKVLTFRYQNNLKKQEVINGVSIMRMPYFFKVSKGFISPQSLYYFLKEALNGEVVFLNIPNFEGLPLAIFARLFGKKVIAIFHCQVDLGPGIINRIINFFLNFSVFFQLFLSDKIIGYTDDYMKSLWVGRFFKNKVSICLPPINQPPMLRIRQPADQPPGLKTIGFAGRASTEKGIEYLIEATSKLKDNISIKLLFAGPFGGAVVGEKNYYSKIKTLLDEKRLDYEFLGNLDENALSDFYRSIDVLVLPSTNHTEAFGMVQVEAMLAGTAVIATNLPGVRVPIQLTKMGILVEPKNSKALAETISEILKNKTKYANKNLQNNAIEIFDINKVYAFYDKI